MTWISNRFMQIAVLAALCGMTMGLIMGASEDFTIAPAHAHLNLLGWVSMMIYAFFYRSFPSAARGWLAASQFWVSLLGLVVLIPSLALMLLGHKEATVGVTVGSILTFLSMLMFAAIVYGATTRKAADAETRAAA